jgi:hypothetical protein
MRLAIALAALAAATGCYLSLPAAARHGASTHLQAACAAAVCLAGLQLALEVSVAAGCLRLPTLHASEGTSSDGGRASVEECEKHAAPAGGKLVATPAASLRFDLTAVLHLTAVGLYCAWLLDSAAAAD